MARKKWKRELFTIERFFLIIIAVFVVTFLSFAALAIMEEIEMNKYVEADILRVVDNTVIVGHNCTAIVAETSPERARSIELGISGDIQVRPNTHDLFKDVLESYNITLEMVAMDDFDDEMYYSTIYFKKGNEEVRLDAKPSDAFALALRTDSPIYIKKGVLEEQGKNICK